MKKKKFVKRGPNKLPMATLDELGAMYDSMATLKRRHDTPMFHLLVDKALGVVYRAIHHGNYNRKRLWRLYGSLKNIADDYKRMERFYSQLGAIDMTAGNDVVFTTVGEDKLVYGNDRIELHYLYPPKAISSKLTIVGESLPFKGRMMYSYSTLRLWETIRSRIGLYAEHFPVLSKYS